MYFNILKEENESPLQELRVLTKTKTKTNLNWIPQLMIHSLFPLGPFLGIILYLLLLRNSYCFPLIILYSIYILFLDKQWELGGRSNQFFKSLKMWYYYSDYFSTQLIVSDVSTFSTNSSYIFGYHPHGILALGAFSSFLTNYCNIQQILDGFNIRLATIPLNFYLPFYREIFQLMGFISCSKTSILNSLNLNNSQGNIVVLPIGGAREALFARPGKMDLILKNRLGFIKLALITGAHLVPVINLGENYLADQYEFDEKSIFYAIRKFIQQRLGLSIPLYIGSGIMTGSKGYLPRKKPLVTIVGKPIIIEKDINPSEEKVLEIHQTYINELEELYIKSASTYFPKELGPIPQFNLI